MKNIKHKNIDQLETMSMNSTVIQTFTVNNIKENVIQNDLELEEDIADAEFRRDFPQILTKNNKTEADLKLRENLICKIKRVWDEFKLSDDTFFRTVFLYDLQDRIKVNPKAKRFEEMKETIGMQI